MELSRMDLFKMSVLGSGAIALPVERSVSGLSLLSSRIAESALPAPFTTPFSRPVTIFSVLLRRHLRGITPKAPISAMW
jgi:spore coat protein A, manganese oxidase